MLRVIWFAVLMSVVPAHLARAQAPIIGDVEGGEFRPFPIAVPNMRLGAGAEGEGAAAALLTKIVRDDLALSGAFQVLDPKSYLDGDGLTQATVRFPDWTAIGAAGLVKAQLKIEGGRTVVDVHGFEVINAKEGLNLPLAGTRAELRALGHAIADEVFRYFTGEPGIFRTKIAAVRKVKGEKHVFLVDIDGDGQRQVTKDGGLDLLPSFTPDGGGLLYTSYRADNPDLYEISLADGAARKVSSRPGLNTGGRVSPDGGKIALTLSQDQNSEVYLLDRQGQVLRRLTTSWGIDTSPAWSPDGAKIAFVSSRAGTPQIYVVDAAGDDKAAKRLTFQGTYNQTPAYSPRGTHLAFTARDERNRFDIFVIDLRSGDVKRVTQDQGNNEEPSFSPNGRLLVFTTTRNGGKQIVVSNMDGTHQTVVTSTGEWSSPSWGPFPRR